MRIRVGAVSLPVRKADVVPQFVNGDRIVGKNQPRKCKFVLGDRADISRAHRAFGGHAYTLLADRRCCDACGSGDQHRGQ